MADFLVSRIQNRRGRHVDLPQPLRPGEFGLATDTSRLFIGGLPSEVSSGVRIFFNSVVSAQSMLDNQILVAKFTGTPDIDAFKSYLATFGSFPTAEPVINPTDPTIPDFLIHYDEDGTQAFIGMSVAQSAAFAEYITDIDAYDPGNVATSLVSYLIDTDTATFTTGSHDEANALSSVMNGLNTPTAIATTNLNIEVMTEYSPQITTDPNDESFFDPMEFVLTPTGVFTDFPSGGIEYDVDVDSDSFVMEYSCYLDHISDAFHGTGKFLITASTKIPDANLDDEFTFIDNLALASSLVEFQAVMSGTDVKLQYKNSSANNVIFKTVSRRWKSF